MIPDIHWCTTKLKIPRIQAIAIAHHTSASVSRRADAIWPRVRAHKRALIYPETSWIHTPGGECRHPARLECLCLHAYSRGSREGTRARNRLRVVVGDCGGGGGGGGGRTSRACSPASPRKPRQVVTECMIGYHNSMIQYCDVMVRCIDVYCHTAKQTIPFHTS